MATPQSVDILLVGGGVMSATLGTLLAELDPSLNIVMLEKQEKVASESTDGWNNAGTGHAGYCELNYTPQLADGRVEIQRALGINAAYETSLQLWSYLVEKGLLPSPNTFIRKTPHESFVWGDADTQFLRRRHAALQQHPLFQDMEFTQDPTKIAEWVPLVMQGRQLNQPLAATRVRYGTDVDFGALTRALISKLQDRSHFQLMLQNSVTRLRQNKNGRWQVHAWDAKAGNLKQFDAGFVFLGAGGGALPLLQKSGIPEAQGYGGFPVSGLWLVCNNQTVISQHQAKVYGKAPLGAPPMSVPHLDTRYINGQAGLLFGPYAGFTTKFLKQGSWLDLPGSVGRSNLWSVLNAGRHNLDLTRYLIGEVFQSQSDRVKALRQFYPQAQARDWSLAQAGQRVQIIKRCTEKGGKLEFGTEIVSSSDGTLAALLGASPGASTSVPAMLQVIERSFASRVASNSWQEKLREMIPSYGKSLIENSTLLEKVRSHNLNQLQLN